MSDDNLTTGTSLESGSGAMSDHNLNVKQQKFSLRNGFDDRRLKLLCRTISNVSSNGDVLVTKTFCSVEEASKEIWDLRPITSCSHESISLISGRNEMEDALSMKLDFLRNYDFFGVYDGHGGSSVALSYRDLLHCLLQMEVIIEKHGKLEEINWGKVMRTSFCKMDEEVNKNFRAEVATIGSTAVVAMVGEEEV
ncbi:hypothetical protein HAX54_049003 [Datura stramonium]|uniref:protein-serine/threonine phosphatase n=1 Tax=Datura stramonium TaxID=4076 RepID=A0ABS8SV11_DATST|nr:hypothetical protein [Datura stramonium]